MNELALTININGLLEEEDYNVIDLDAGFTRNLFARLGRMFHGIKIQDIWAEMTELCTKLGIEEVSIDVRDIYKDIPANSADLIRLKHLVAEDFFRDRSHGVSFDSIAWQYATTRRNEVKRFNTLSTASREIGV